MALLDSLAAKGLAFASKGVSDGKWFDASMDKLEGVASKLAPGEEARTKDAISTIRSTRSDFVHLGEDGFTAMVGFFAVNDKAKAQLVFLAQSAGLDDLFAASDQSTGDLVAAKAKVEDRKKTWASIASKLELTARILLPVLIAAL